MTSSEPLLLPSMLNLRGCWRLRLLWELIAWGILHLRRDLVLEGTQGSGRWLRGR